MQPESVEVALIIIGDEVLYGQTKDTNAHFIETICDFKGLPLCEVRTIRDDEQEIFEALSSLAQKYNVVITSGGLGPTRDDKTKKVMSTLLASPLEINLQAWQWVKDFCEANGKNFNELNQKQAEIPQASKALRNEWGTASALLSEYSNALVFNLPGVPFELENLFTQKVLPEIEKRFSWSPVVHEFIYTKNLAESELSLLLNDLELESPKEVKWAFLPSKKRVKVRLTTRREHENLLKPIKRAIQNKIPESFHANAPTWLEEISQDLKEKGKSISCAESFTAGQLASTFTQIPGSSSYFKGGVVAYAADLKVELLKVSSLLIKEKGTVNREVAQQMAENIRVITGSDYGISTTGVAGPDQDEYGNEVGLAWVAFSSRDQTQTFQFNIKNKTREEFTRVVILELLQRFHEFLQKDLH